MQKRWRLPVELRVYVIANIGVVASRILVDAGDHVAVGIDQAARSPAGAAEEINREEIRRRTGIHAKCRALLLSHHKPTS